jgi:hypothetical protein
LGGLGGKRKPSGLVPSWVQIQLPVPRKIAKLSPKQNFNQSLILLQTEFEKLASKMSAY